MPRPTVKAHHSDPAAQFSSLIVRQANRAIPDLPDVHALPTGTMVKRNNLKPDIVAQPVRFQSGIAAKGAKAEQAWRYPNNQIVRAPTIHLGTSGRAYTDPKSDQEKPRRLQESNFFITCNPNKGFSQADVSKAAGVMWEVLKDMFSQENVFKLITLGPKNPEVYGEDLIEDVIRNVESTPTVEVGSKKNRMHSHIILEIEHFSQVQINIPIFRQLYTEAYNRFGEKVGLKMPRGLYLKVDMLPQSNWTTVSKNYVKKAMLASQPDVQL